MVSKARKGAVFNPRPGALFKEVKQVAHAARVQLYLTEVPGAEGYERVFESIVKAHADALLVPSSPRFSSRTHSGSSSWR